MMRGGPPPPSDPNEWVAAVTGWQREMVDTLRAAVRAGGTFAEIVKWHNLVFLANGPCVLIRAEETRVLLGFWRGKRLVDRDPRLKPGGKYELANMVLREGDPLDPARVTRLAAAAHALNAELGDPTRLG